MYTMCVMFVQRFQPQCSGFANVHYYCWNRRGLRLSKSLNGRHHCTCLYANLHGHGQREYRVWEIYGCFFSAENLELPNVPSGKAELFLYLLAEMRATERWGCLGLKVFRCSACLSGFLHWPAMMDFHLLRQNRTLRGVPPVCFWPYLYHSVSETFGQNLFQA